MLMQMKWVHSDSMVAQRLSGHELRGFFSKKIYIGEYEHAFIEKDGKIVDEACNRTVKLNGLFGRAHANIIIFDQSEKRLQRPVTDLLTADRVVIHAYVLINFRVAGFNSFMERFMKFRNAVLIEDIWSEIKEDFISKVICPAVSKVTLSELSGTDAFQNIFEGKSFAKMKDSLGSIGITLVSVSFNPAFSYENRKEIERAGNGVQKADADVIISRKLKKAEEVSSNGLDREAVISEMENERIRRETEMHLEREETQTDIEEAMEALELKDIKNKQKLLDEIDKLKLSIDPKDSDREKTIKNLETEIENLRMSRDMAEKKFYKNEISEDNFRKLADDYERKIIELKTKIEGLKKPN